MKFIKLLLLSFFLVVLSTFGKAQVVNDAGLWSTFNVEKKLNKTFSVLFTEECRVKENFTRLNLFYTNIGVQAQPFKFAKVALVYRWIDKYMIDNTFSYRHRLMLDITLKKKYGSLAFSYRQRLQAEVRNIHTSEIGNIPEWYSRNKIAVKYDADGPFSPYASVEFRYQFKDPRNIESDKTWHRNRYAIGIDYKRNDKSTFGLYYLIQNEFNVSAPEDLYIVGLEYSLTL